MIYDSIRTLSSCRGPKGMFAIEAINNVVEEVWFRALLEQ